MAAEDGPTQISILSLINFSGFHSHSSPQPLSSFSLCENKLAWWIKFKKEYAACAVMWASLTASSVALDAGFASSTRMSRLNFSISLYLSNCIVLLESSYC